jgi:bacterioferritin-associated ferredoxin
MAHERQSCTCHEIDISDFRQACEQGAHSVKTCFKSMGCLPKCNDCIPMVRKLLKEYSTPRPVR